MTCVGFLFRPFFSRQVGATITPEDDRTQPKGTTDVRQKSVSRRGIFAVATFLVEHRMELATTSGLSARQVEVL